MNLDDVGQTSSLSDAFERMLGALGHRGPDGRGEWHDDGVSLGCTRLAINDPSDTGDQPMHLEGRDLHLVCNGEIYNHRELRRDLEARGAGFRGDSDVEVLLHGYAAWGAEIFNRAAGMFAAAIWDGRARAMVLARDRMGEKPLYVCTDGRRTLFGSEVKAVLAAPGVARDPDPAALEHYLTYGYCPSRQTAFREIERLKPGEILTLEQGRPVRRDYIQETTAAPSDASGPGPAGELRTRLDAAVARQVRADVPVGVLLSGGLDSSTIAALAAASAADTIDTFTVGFPDAVFDERTHARAVAEHLGTRHHDAVIEEGPTDLLPALADHLDEPFADPSALPAYCLSRFVAGTHKAVLSGDGADELFLGYTRYGNCHDLEWTRAIPRPLRAAAGALHDRLPATESDRRWVRVLRRHAARLDLRESRGYGPWVSIFSDADRRRGYGDGLVARDVISPLDLLDSYMSAAGSRAEGAANADLHTYLPGDILYKVDMMSMAHGLEVRAPFLDPAVVGFARQTPADIRMAGGVPKHLLRCVSAELLPQSILDRPKQGFGAPVDDWVRGPLRDMCGDLILGSRFRDRGILKPGFTEKLLGDHWSGRWDNGRRIWALLMLEMWYLTWIDTAPGVITR